APFLEHLRGRLDEVPFGAHAGDPRPPGAAAEQVVQEVPELVEERHHLAVLEQRAWAREIANQGGLGKPLSRLPRLQGELRGVLVFAVARMEVEVEAPDHLAVLDDVIAGDVRVPDGSAGKTAVFETEEARGHFQDAVLHPRHLEIGPDRLRVVAVAFLAQRLGEDLRVPRLDAAGARVGALPVYAPELFARRLAAGVRKERDVVGIVGGDRHLAVRARWMAPDVVFRQPREVRRVQLDIAHVLADVAAEFLPDAHQLLVEGLHSLARRLVAVDAR